MQRGLNANPEARAERRPKGVLYQPDADHMEVLLRRHLNDRPFDEFNALVAKHPQVRHAVVFRESTSAFAVSG